MKRPRQPDGTMNSMMKQCQWKERPFKDSESKFMIMPNSKVALCAQPNTTKFDIGANLICCSECKCTQPVNQCCRREEGALALGAEPLLS